ncbi:hypothetical protein HDU97_002588 [Phlyctochytrium planicorne]|nr:hypothetical protein HDU97_002588 [Phlyctochytrium planicorne]
MISRTLFHDVTTGAKSLPTWREKVYNELALPSEDWMYLLLDWITFLEEKVLASRPTLLRLCEIVYEICHVSLLKQSICAIDMAVDFCLSSSQIVMAVLMKEILRNIFKTEEHSLPNALDRLLSFSPQFDDCWFLVNVFGDPLVREAQLTVASLGADECESIPFLYSNYAISQTLQASFGRDEQNVLKKKLFGRFTPLTNNRISIYLIQMPFEKVSRDVSNLESLSRLIRSHLKEIKHPVLRNGLSAYIVDHCMSSRLSLIAEVIEKGRKAPQESLCLKLCGMPRDIVVQYFDLCLSVLDESFMIIDPVYCTVSDMKNDFAEVLEVPALVSVQEYAIGPIGRILKWLSTMDSNLCIER